MDRSAEPWTTSTSPYASAATWPVRADAYRAAGPTDDDVDPRVRSATILLAHGGVDVAVNDGRSAVRGEGPLRPAHLADGAGVPPRQ
jgi:hypothetical protein